MYISSCEKREVIPKEGHQWIAIVGTRRNRPGWNIRKRRKLNYVYCFRLSRGRRGTCDAKDRWIRIRMLTDISQWPVAYSLLATALSLRTVVDMLVIIFASKSSLINTSCDSTRPLRDIPNSFGDLKHHECRWARFNYRQIRSTAV